MLPNNEFLDEKKNFDWENFLFRYKFQIFFILLGTFLVGLGLFYVKKEKSVGNNSIQVLDNATEGQNDIVVEIAGQVETPGVYKLQNGSRIEDLLILSGGISANADRTWLEKSLNRASKLVDGQKIYIPSVDEQTNVLSANNSGGYQTTSSISDDQGSGLININTASQKELESLTGIGPVYAQNIIEHRPYSSVEELTSKGALGDSTYEKIKDKVSVY